MEGLKEKMVMVVAIVIIIAIFGLIYYFFEYHEDIYYTQIDNAKIEKISTSDNMKYRYTLNCYNEKGKKKEIKFKTSRELRDNSFLKLKVLVTGVNSWEEVQYDELPDKVKAKYIK